MANVWSNIGFWRYLPLGLSLMKTSGHHLPPDHHKINDLKYLSNLHMFHNTNNLNVQKKAK